MGERKCRVCKAVLTARTLPEIAGEEGPLAVKVHGLPVLECPNGHRHFAHADFPLQLLDRLVEQDEARLPASTTRGVLFKQHHCSSCGEKLTESANKPHTFHLDVALPQCSRFDVELTVPVHRCSHCGHEQLHSLKDLRHRTPAALAHAFKGAAIAAPA